MEAESPPATEEEGDAAWLASARRFPWMWR